MLRVKSHTCPCGKVVTHKCHMALLELKGIVYFLLLLCFLLFVGAGGCFNFPFLYYTWYNRKSNKNENSVQSWAWRSCRSEEFSLWIHKHVCHLFRTKTREILWWRHTHPNHYNQLDPACTAFLKGPSLPNAERHTIKVKASHKDLYSTVSDKVSSKCFTDIYMYR